LQKPIHRNAAWGLDTHHATRLFSLHKIRTSGWEPCSSIVSSSSNPAQLRPYIGPRRKVRNLRCVVTSHTYSFAGLVIWCLLPLCRHVSYRPLPCRVPDTSASAPRTEINGQSVRNRATVFGPAAFLSSSIIIRDVFGHRLRSTRVAVRGRSDGHRTGAELKHLQLGMDECTIRSISRTQDRKHVSSSRTNRQHLFEELSLLSGGLFVRRAEHPAPWIENPLVKFEI
jgi:hypothetical protein